MVLLIRPGVSGITFSAAVFIIISEDFETWLAKSPENPVSSCQEQHEIVAVHFSVPAESEITEQPSNETVAYAPAIRVIYSGFSVEIQNTAASETIRNTITALRQLC